MTDIKSYILGIVIAAIICGIVQGLVDIKTTAGKVVTLLSGLFMAFTVLTPIADISFRDVTAYFDSLSVQADSYAQEGSAAAFDSMRGIIKSRTSAYILDKADSMGLEITVEVGFDGGDDTVPSSVVIGGDVTPYKREVLAIYIENNLGITKEHQQWN